MEEKARIYATFCIEFAMNKSPLREIGAITPHRIAAPPIGLDGAD
jgi:hypothetical protein